MEAQRVVAIKLLWMGQEVRDPRSAREPEEGSDRQASR